MKVHRPKKIEVEEKVYKIVDKSCEFFVYSKISKNGNFYYFSHMGVNWPISINGKYSCYDIFELSKVEEVLL